MCDVVSSDDVADERCNADQTTVWIDLCSGNGPIEVANSKAFRFGQAIVLGCLAAVVVLFFFTWVV